MLLEQPQSIRTIFFDAGFTLLRPYPSEPEIYQHVCQQMGLAIHLEQITMHMEAAETYLFRQTRLNRSLWADEQAIVALWRGYYTHLLRPFVAEQDETMLSDLAERVRQEFASHTRWQIYSDVIGTLEVLKERGYRLGIISDWGSALGPILQKLHLNRYFDCLLISAVTRHAKPAPELYELALQRVNAIGDYSLHIGDSYINDVLGARAAGITPVLLDRARKLQKSNVDCLLVHTLDELLDLLEVARI